MLKNIFSHCIELKRQKKKRPGKTRDPLFFLSLDLKLILWLHVIKQLQSEFKGNGQISSKPSNRFFRSSFETRLSLFFSGFCGKRNSRNVGKTEKKKNLKQKIERKLFFSWKFSYIGIGSKTTISCWSNLWGKNFQKLFFKKRRRKSPEIA